MFQLKTEDRLRSWREFRSSIDKLSLEEALNATAELWSHAPFTPYYLDIDNLDSWPDPWQLIDENVYCDVAKSLGIIYTMLLTEHRHNLDIELRVYKDVVARVEYNLSCFNDGKYILNLIDRQVVNKEQLENEPLELKLCLTASQLKLENY
jgi:hypothetical protein